MGICKRPLLSLGLLAALVHGEAALAQSGGVSAPQGLSGIANVDVTYDDNILDGLQGVSGSSRGDFRITPSLQLRYDMPVGRQGLYAIGTVGYDFYARNDDFNAAFWRVGAGANWALGGRCTGVAEADYEERQSSFGDLGVAVKNIEKNQTYLLNAMCGRAVGLGLTAGVQHFVSNNGNNLLERNDLRTTRYTAGLLYRTPVLGNLTLTGNHEDRTYPNRFVGGERDGLKIDSVEVAVARPANARLQGSARVSYVWTNPDITGYESFKGVNWYADLGYTVSPKLSVGVQASREVQSDAAIGSSYNVYRNIGANVDYRLSPAVTLSAGLSDGHRRFIGVDPLLLLPARTAEDLNYYYVQVRYAPPQRRWELGLRGARDERKSDTALYDYKSNSITLSASYRF